jgi:hypothetical protein
MKDLIQRILTEMTSQPKIGSDPLVQMLVDSTKKSIELGESIETVYSNLKKGIVSVNEKIKSPSLTSILEQIKRNENTIDLQVLKIAKGANLAKRLQTIRESEAFSNPIVKTRVNSFEDVLANGAPDFSICSHFVESFAEYGYDKKVSQAVEKVKSYLAEKRSTLAVISTIYQMNSPIYAGASNDLKSMLVAESYSADILKMKYGTSVPLITSLISELRILESQKTGNFTLGEGNFDTKVNNMIAPSIRIEEGVLIYADDRFISIRESRSLTGHESKLHIDDRFKIAEMNVAYVKEAYSTFYQVCEAFATLGFSPRSDGFGVESKNIPNLTLGFILNENKGFDLHVNGNKMESVSTQNVSEALSMHRNQTRARVNLILENFSTVCNLEFVKTLSNDRTLAEATVFDIEGSYFVCEKVNAADRSWKKMDEHEMYEFFGSKFNYDISPIFKVQIEESIEVMKAIERKKAAIQVDIQKLGESVSKLSTACANPSLDPSEISKLEAIKESIEQTIHGLKLEYIKVDLLKKKQLA